MKHNTVSINTKREPILLLTNDNHFKTGDYVTNGKMFGELRYYEDEGYEVMNNGVGVGGLDHRALNDDFSKIIAASIEIENIPMLSKEFIDNYKEDPHKEITSVYFTNNLVHADTKETIRSLSKKFTLESSWYGILETNGKKELLKLKVVGSTLSEKGFFGYYRKLSLEFCPGLGPTLQKEITDPEKTNLFKTFEEAKACLNEYAIKEKQEKLRMLQKELETVQEELNELK